MGRTRKVKTTGRFGPRYGRKTRSRVIAVEKVQKKKHECPECAKTGLKRLSQGIYYCTKCGAKFTGRAYYP